MVTIFTALLLTATPPIETSVRVTCIARDNSARILRTAAPNDVHPDWSGDNVIGTGHRFIAGKRLSDTFGLLYLRGDLVSPRGGALNRDVLILAQEWRCRSR